MSRVIEFVKGLIRDREPVVAAAVAGFLASVAVRFGLSLDPGVEAAISGLIVAALTAFARQRVSPI